MDRLYKQKYNTETVALGHDILGQMDLIDIFRAFHPKTAEYTFFSTAHGTFSRIDHVRPQNKSQQVQKESSLIPFIFSHHNTVKLEINHKTKIWKEHMEVK